MPRRKLFVHVGPHKTGSSTIMRGLVHNRAELLKKGYHYPDIGLVYFGHHNIVAELENPDFRDPKTGGLTDLKNLAQSGQEHVILASEWFDKFETDKPWKRLKTVMGGMFDIHLTGYLRPQEELLQSLWKTTVKNECLNIDFDGWLPQAMKDHQFLKYDEWLTQLASVFGQENLHFELYDQASDDLLHRFLGLCGIEDFTSLKTEPRYNVSMPGLIFEMTRHLYISPFIERTKGSGKRATNMHIKYDKISKIMTNFAQKEGINLDYSCYSKDMLQKVRQTYRPHNQKAAQKFFGRPSLFEAGTRLKPAPKNLIDLVSPEQVMRLTGILIEMEQKQARFARAVKANAKA